ncbi:MAG TPA: glycoside hydrolase family 5 protein [Bryobacteraceae bacterium]|jgi:endoglucanase|nr:glycoside hydrolase family 5 protein [Bryobacteraceae bacterium]
MKQAAIGLVACFLAIAAAWPAEKSVTDFHTSGNRIVDAQNRPVRLCGINWYGFETKFFIPHGIWSRDYKYLLDAIKANGFNMIRLPFADETIQSDPKSTKISFESGNNADLHDLTAMQIMDKIVAYANQLGLYIVLDNHRSEAGDSAESSGLWYNGVYPESTWLKDWETIARRYRDVPALIGMDLRNEPHNAHIGGSCWTGDETSLVPGCPESDVKHNWPMAATRAANELLAINPKWLMFIEGVDEYSHDWYWNGGNLEGVRKYPVVLNVKNKVVYSPHEYGPRLYHQPWFNASTTAELLNEVRRKYWGYVNEEGIAPVWIGEFGTQNRPDRVASDIPGSQGQWFSNFIQYLQDHPEVNWAYWALNGSDGDGLLDKDYSATPPSMEKMAMLKKVQK